MEQLKREFNYYLTHQNELVEKFNGKFIVIKNENVIGAYDSELEAVKKTVEHHELGTFLVQRCQPGEEGHTQAYHSRVAVT